MECFQTEKSVERNLRKFFMPILLPNGKKEMAEVTLAARDSYEALKEMGVPEARLMRYAKQLQERTGMDYNACYTMGLVDPPLEFFEDLPPEPPSSDQGTGC